MGNRPPWWEVEPAEPVDRALICPPRTETKTPVSNPKQRDNDVHYIQKVVRESYGDLRDCYEKTLGRDPATHGRVSIRFVIEASGEASSACVDTYEIADGSLLECMTNVFKSLRFKPNDDGVTTVVYPVILEIGKEPALWYGK